MKIDRESRIPIQHQLYESLKRWFIHDFTVDDTLPTEAVIAKRYAVSRGTVRNAMDRLVNDGLIERVPGRGTFLNKRYYIHLKDYHIGVILCDTDFFTNSIWEYIWSTHLGIMNGIVGKGLTYNISTEFISEEFFSSEDDRFYDGFIIWPYVHSTIFDRISKPYVILDYDIDVRTGFTLLAEDIARHDYEQLAFIGFTSGKRIEAVNDTLAEHGRPIVEDDHIVQCGGNPKEAYRSCSSLMNHFSDIDCIICSTDLRAQGVIEYLQETGRSIPEEVSVYGFDGPMHSSSFSPRITTCCFDWKYPGELSVKRIRAILDGNPIPPYLPPAGIFMKHETTR